MAGSGKKIFIKAYKRSDGTKVKGHSSRPKGRKSRGGSKRKSSKSSTKSSRKLVCTPPKSMRVRSYKRSNGKRVKAHCSKPRGGRRVRVDLGGLGNMTLLKGANQDQKYPDEDEDEIPMPILTPCSDLNQGECNDALDQNKLRRCRVNFKTRLCEDLPEEFRERATYQIGGSATYTPYQAGERVRLSREQIRPYQREEEERRLNMLIDNSERDIQEGKRLLREIDEVLKK